MSPPDAAARVRAAFAASAELKRAAAAALAPAIARAADRMRRVLADGGRILACGNGGSAADALHFAAELVGRYERDRPGLAALALCADSAILTALANDFDYPQVYARQVEALGRPGDLLLAISTSGRSPSVVAAVTAAQARGMEVVALTGRDGGQLARGLRAQDLELRVPHQVTARIQEVHILCLHCLCELLDEDEAGPA